MDEIKELKLQIERNSKKDQEAIDKLNQWKWTVGGGIIAVSWLISHLDSDIIGKLIN